MSDPNGIRDKRETELAQLCASLMGISGPMDPPKCLLRIPEVPYSRG